MTVQQFFIGWDRPIAESISGFILSKEVGYPVDLSRRLIVVSTRLVGFKVHARVGGYPIRPSNKPLVLLKEHA